jgi:hypothetical protein
MRGGSRKTRAVQRVVCLQISNFTRSRYHGLVPLSNQAS